LKILAVRHAVPDRRVTNDAVVEAIRERNRRHMDAVGLAAVETRLRRHLTLAGTDVRYLSDGRNPIHYVRDAGEQALRAAGVPARAVDFLIYAGIGRAWLEPAMANAVQHQLGVVDATCFDVLDACASWLRALQIAHSFIRNRTYRLGMIVNCEVGLERFADLDLSQADDVEAKLAAFTIGEAATATVVTDDVPDDDFYFNFKNFGQHYGLCMIPLDDGMRFFSQSRQLIRTTVKEIVRAYRADSNLSGATYDICFGHTASQKANEIIGRRLGLAAEIEFQTRADYGNTVAASIPLGMSLAIQQGRLRRGHRTLCIMGSAGITVGFAKFTF
jgi:3-oxoacyl-[acyl-carrier-protein] synthase III